LGEGTVSNDLFTSASTFVGPPLGQGENVLRLSLNKPGGLFVEGIEVKTEYNEADA